MKIPERVLRAAWIKGADVSWKTETRGRKVMELYTAEQNWRRERKRNLAGIKAAAEVLVQWMKDRGKVKGH